MTRGQKSTILLIVIICFAISLMAQTSEEGPLTLDQCINIAIQENPLVLSAVQQYNASLARINQAKAFAQPSINWDSDLQSKLFNFNNSGEWYFGVSQEIEFPGKRILRGKIASREAGAILQDVELLKLDIVFQVKQAFYSLLLSQEKLRYAQQNLELAQDYMQKAELKYEAGDVAKVEALRARVETSKAANEVRIATNEVRLAKAMLNFLLARRKYAPIEIKGNLKKAPIELNTEELVDRSLSFRPEIKRINLGLERENLTKKQSYMSYLPDFELGVNKHRIIGEGDFWDFTLSFPVPLFFWQPKKGEIAEAEANIRALSKEAEYLQNAITLEVEEATMSAMTASNQIRLFEEDILAQAEEVYNMFLFSYQEGEIGGIELIEARRTLIEARTSYADALFNYGVALAALEKSIGQRLQGDGQ
jgi:cobalt-zinc-cadmium efflux system outer membrane protein